MVSVCFQYVVHFSNSDVNSNKSYLTVRNKGSIHKYLKNFFLLFHVSLNLFILIKERKQILVSPLKLL